MAFDFLKLDRDAQRAAFAHMAAGKGKAARKIVKAHSGGLSQSYMSGRGATDNDVKTLARRFMIMHGRAPTAKELSKIKRARG